MSIGKKHFKIQESKKSDARRIGSEAWRYQSSGIKMGIGSIYARCNVASCNSKCIGYYVE